MKKKNRYDEYMKDYYTSKTFRIKLILRIMLYLMMCSVPICFFLSVFKPTPQELINLVKTLFP